MMTVRDFLKKKNKKEKITFVTCYDYTAAKIVEASDVDCILVGDSGVMTMCGAETTLPATIGLMTQFTCAVVKGISKKFIVADMPFMSYRKSLENTMEAVQSLMQAGAHAIKLEGVAGNLDTIKHIVASGVPVMGHIGLTPQSFHALGGYRVQGRGKDAAMALEQQAQVLQEAGCFSLVLECVPNELARNITSHLDIPTIGIGAGPYTDGQVLVWQDLLGMHEDLHIKFVKQYFNGFEVIKNSLNTYHREVSEAVYPDLKKHCYSGEVQHD